MSTATMDHDTVAFDPGERVAPAPEEVPQVTGTGNPRTPSTPGRKPGQRTGTGKKRATSSAPPRPGGAPRPPSSSKAKTDYRPGIMGLFQLIAAPLGLAARARRNPALAADGVAIVHHGANVAEALNETAKHVDHVARALDKILTAGPYGLVLAAVMPLGAQLAVNHGVIPVELGMQLGAVDPRELLGDDAPGDSERAAA